MDTELKKLDLSKGGFKTAKNKYRICATMSADMFYKFKEFEIEWALEKSVDELIEDLNTTYKHINNRKDADAAVSIYNTLKAVGNMSQRYKPALKICSCFLMKENEDMRFWNEDVMMEKIDDWLEEGIDYMSFFQLAANTGSGLKKILEGNSQDSSTAK